MINPANNPHHEESGPVLIEHVELTNLRPPARDESPCRLPAGCGREFHHRTHL